MVFDTMDPSCRCSVCVVDYFDVGSIDFVANRK